MENIITQISLVLSYALIVANMTERTVELLKGIVGSWWQNQNIYTKKAITMVVALLWSLPAYQQIGWNFVYVGLIGSLGSNVVHSIISLIDEYRKNVKQKNLVNNIAIMSMVAGGDMNADTEGNSTVSDEEDR